MAENLAEALPKEQKRVRELVKVYRSLDNNAGVPAAMLMEASLEQAEKAAASGDVTAMIAAYMDLRDYEE